MHCNFVYLETLWAKLLKCVWAEEQEARRRRRRGVTQLLTCAGTTNGAEVGEYLHVSLQRSGLKSCKKKKKTGGKKELFKCASQSCGSKAHNLSSRIKKAELLQTHVSNLFNKSKVV